MVVIQRITEGAAPLPAALPLPVGAFVSTFRPGGALESWSTWNWGVAIWIVGG